MDLAVTRIPRVLESRMNDFGRSQLPLQSESTLGLSNAKVTYPKYFQIPSHDARWDSLHRPRNKLAPLSSPLSVSPLPQTEDETYQASQLKRTRDRDQRHVQLLFSTYLRSVRTIKLD